MAPAAALSAAATALQVPAAATAVDLGDAVTPAQEFLVWQEVQGKNVTWWIQVQPGDSHVLGRRDGLWLAARDDVYGWKVTRRRVRACDAAACALQDGACESTLVAGGPFQGRIDDVELVGLLSPRPRPLGPRLADSAALDLGTPGLQRLIRPTAQLGALLLVEVVTETLSCGPMHGETTREPRLAVVPDGALLPAADLGLQSELDNSISEATRALFRQEHPKVSGPLRWLTLHQQRQASGSWTLQEEWVGEEPAALGRGQLRSLRIAVAQLPAAWQEHASQAPDLRELADALPAPPTDAGEVHAGWSRIDAPAPRRALLRQRFLASTKGP